MFIEWMIEAYFQLCGDIIKELFIQSIIILTIVASIIAIIVYKKGKKDEK